MRDSPATGAGEKGEKCAQQQSVYKKVCYLRKNL